MQLLGELGLLMFSLLDYGVKEDQEQPLSSSMEFFIESLTVQQEEEEESDPEYWRGCQSPILSSADSGISEYSTLILSPESLSDIIKVLIVILINFHLLLPVSVCLYRCVKLVFPGYETTAPISGLFVRTWWRKLFAYPTSWLGGVHLCYVF